MITLHECEENAAARAALACKLEQDRSFLLLMQPFTAALALRLQLVATSDLRIPTAATDGKYIYFNVDFAAGLDDATRRFVLCHEVWHCVMGHIARQQKRENKRWNIAIDYEVNSICEELLKFVPPMALYDAHWKGKSAEFIYDHLSDCVPPEQQRVLDEHLAISAETQQQWREYTRQLMLDGKHRGHLSIRLRAMLEKALVPALPWRQLLERFVQKQANGERQWYPPSRRHIYRGLYLPRQRSEFLELTVAIDVSGSCAKELSQFLAQLDYILNTYPSYQVTVLTCDTEIQSITEVTPEQALQVDQIAITGFGGTSFYPVFNYVNEHPTLALIYFTDGDANISSIPPEVPVMWVLTADATDNMPWGEVARMY
jgi:predicted metal-dependent peptidase